KALAGIDVRALDERLGRRAGELLARSGTSDVVDAALVVLAENGDDIITSDPEDIEPLAALAGLHVELLRA
ncbi:MAG TPA: PIN domain nuclease, partial [Gammaproteobacteria bacterium]|nr:PIN domain nuclease [Gammaproteobacteria bacterium]